MSVYPILYPYNASTEKLTWEIVGDSVTVVPNSIAPDYREITAATPGITTIRAKVDNVYSDLLIIEVKENFCTITNGPIDDSSAINKTFTLGAYSEPSFADLSWESSNKAVATIDPETGTVTTHSFGSTIITLTATVGDFSCTYTITLDVTDLLYILIEEYPAENTLVDGETCQLTTYVFPENLDNPSLTWLSLDPSVVSVSNTGLITAVNPGTTEIQVSSTTNPLVCDWLKITVKEKRVKSIKITNIPTDYTLYLGESYDLNYAIEPADASYQGATWISDDPSVAEINENGVITTRSRGTTYITLKPEAQSESIAYHKFLLKVKEVGVSGTNKPEDNTMYVGETHTVGFVTIPANYPYQSAKWDSSDRSVADINPTTGKITALSSGKTKISVTVVINNITEQRSFTLTVKLPPPTSVSITNKPTNNTLTVGDTHTLGATVLPAKASQSVTWSSSDTNVATVSSSGLVRANKAGTTTITVKTAQENLSGSYLLTVDNLIIYQSEKTKLNDEYGNFAEDLNLNDIPEKDLVENHSINWKNIETTSVEDFRNSWTNLCKTTSTGALQQVVLDMIDHFMGGSGSDYSNDILTEKVIEHDSTKSYKDSIISEIKEILSNNKGNISALKYDVLSRDQHPLILQMNEQDIYEPVFNTTIDKIQGLTICLNSLWANEIKITQYNVSQNYYSGTLKFTLYDHFGLDINDVETNKEFKGFSAWYILQHSKKYQGAYRPFVTIIEFEVPFSGSF